MAKPTPEVCTSRTGRPPGQTSRVKAHTTPTGWRLDGQLIPGRHGNFPDADFWTGIASGFPTAMLASGRIASVKPILQNYFQIGSTSLIFRAKCDVCLQTRRQAFGRLSAA
jgi:hypothetical protein